MHDALPVETSPRGMSPTVRRVAAAGLLATVVAGGLLAAATVDRGHNWGGDFAGYILQGQSLIHGRISENLAASRFAFSHSPQHHLWPVAYPWGLPVLLAPVLAVAGVSPLALKAVGVVAFLGLLVLLAADPTRTHPWPWRIVWVAGVALNPAVLDVTNQILSDVPFLLVATAAVLWMAQAVDGRRPLRDGAILGGLMAAAFFLRTNGLLLLPTLAVAQLLARRRSARSATSPKRRIASALMPYAVFAVLVTAWRLFLPHGGTSHLALLRTITPRTIRSNLSYYWRLAAHLFPGVWHPRAVFVATVPFVVLGAIRRGRRDLHQGVWILGTLALYLLWPFQQGLRFLLPVLPFYLSFALTGLAWIAGEAGARARVPRTVACVIPAVAILLVIGNRSLARARANLAAGRQVATGPFAPPAQKLFRFLRTQTPPDATVIFFKPRVLRLLTGRRAFLATDPKALSPGDDLCLITVHHPTRQVSPAVADALVAQGRAKVLFSDARFTVFHLLGPAEAGSAQAGQR